MEKYNSERWNLIKTNQNFRFHYIRGEQNLQIPESVIDFKHYYTVPRSVIYSNYRDHYLATINELFRELLSQRFANYLSRIGVPKLNKQGTSCDT
jgi:predicted metal-dependent hydrolase